MASKDEALLGLTCPRCLASLQVPSLLAGKQCRCPHCQFAVDVPRATGTAAGKDESLPGEDERPPPADQATYIPVVCPVCRTRMYGTVEQVGQKLTCPDCGTASAVPPPQAVARATAAPAAVDVYPLASDAQPATGAPRASEQSYVAFFCHRCQTRLTATLDQVGDTLLCPDCGMANVVPPPPEKKRKAKKEAVSSYRLVKGSEEETPVATEEPEVMGKARLRPHSERPVLPAWPFITGTFTFPFFPTSLARVAVLIPWSLLADELFVQCLALAKIESPVTWIGSALLGTTTGLVIAMWFVFASACALTIVRETSNGCDKIADWPGMAFFDYLLDPFYLVNSLGVSALPATLVVRALSLSGPSADLAPLASFFLVFPFVLMSMLENDSPLGAFSGPVFRSLRTAWPGWLGFYMATIALLVAAGNVVLAFRPAGETWQIIIASPVIVLVWFIYFRLLGRLAWYCAEHGGPEAEDDEESPEGDGAVDGE